MPQLYDCLIIGGCPAGLFATLAQAVFTALLESSTQAPIATQA